MRTGRTEERQLCADLVRVEWKSPSGADRSEWAILEDISSTGACLEIDEQIPPETLVHLQFTGDQCHARVIYCSKDMANYLVGVQFEQGYRWSRRRFKPQHLLQFRLRSVARKR